MLQQPVPLVLVESGQVRRPGRPDPGLPVHRVDSRDQAIQQRLDNLNDAYRLFRRRTIMNCSEVGPKGLEPSHAIEEIRLMMSKLPVRRGALDVHLPVVPT